MNLPWFFILDPFLYRFIQHCKSSSSSSSSSSLSIPLSNRIVSLFTSLDSASFEAFIPPFPLSKINPVSFLNPQTTSLPAAIERDIKPNINQDINIVINKDIDPNINIDMDTNANIHSDMDINSSSNPAFSSSIHFFPFPHYSGFQDRSASFFDPSDVHHSAYQWDDFSFTLQNQSYSSLLYKLWVRGLCVFLTNST